MRPARSLAPLLSGLLCASAYLPVAGIGLTGSGCSREPPPRAAPANPPGNPRPETDKSPSAAVVATAQESRWWFSEGPGLEAIRARLRGDHDTARTRLTELLASELSADDRAAASLLMALEELHAGHQVEALEHLAAARSPALALVDERVHGLVIEAKLEAGDLAGARSELGSGPFDEASSALRAADVAVRTDDAETARSLYQVAVKIADDQLLNEARAKLADSLQSSDDEQDRKRALALWDEILLAAPIGKWGDMAREGEAKLASLRPSETKTERRARTRARQLANLRALYGRQSWKSLERDSKRWVDRDQGMPGAMRCEAEFLRGTAIFKQRDRPRARPVLEAAAKTCARVHDTDREVKARYQAARGRYAEGQFSRAARGFESLAADHAGHSYADDALIKGGEAWESAGDDAKARNAWQRSLDKHMDGDMAGEARRRILVASFRDDPVEDTERRVESWLKHASGDELARLHYFHGRVLAKLGRTEEAAEAWLASLRLRPISYAGMQSMSRLREQGEETMARGLAVLDRSGASSWTDTLEGDSASETLARARLCARLGLSEWARDELERGQIKGWPAVALLGNAGAWGASQRRLADLGTAWRVVAPGPSTAAADDRRRAWELAHPRPFQELIIPGEARHSVPSLLTFAIMQTESRFEPGVTSWAGARGLVQLMPGTAADLARRAGVRVSDAELYDPAINLDLGMLYLGRLAARFGGGDLGTALAIPSYNAGAGSVDKWLASRGDWDTDLFVEAIPYDETRRYTRSVLGRWFAYRWLYGEGSAADRVPYLPLELPSTG